MPQKSRRPAIRRRPHTHTRQLFMTGRRDVRGDVARSNPQADAEGSGCGPTQMQPLGSFVPIIVISNPQRESRTRPATVFDTRGTPQKYKGGATGSEETNHSANFCLMIHRASAFRLGRACQVASLDNKRHHGEPPTFRKSSIRSCKRSSCIWSRPEPCLSASSFASINVSCKSRAKRATVTPTGQNDTHKKQKQATDTHANTV